LRTLFDDTRRDPRPGANRLHNRVVSTSGVDSTAEVVRLLRCPIVGVAEERLGNADMRRIADRQLCRNYLSEQVRVEGAAKLAFGDRADEVADPFRRKRPAAIANPEGIAGDRRGRTAYQLRPVMGEISFDPAGEVVG